MGQWHPEEILLSELTKIEAKSDKPLVFSRYRELGGTFSIGTFQKHFGSWKTAVERVGRRDGHSGRYSDEELFSEIQRLWESYGRQPTYKEMNRDGNISGGVFQHKFGSWMRAIHAFCDDRASVDGKNEPVELPLIQQVEAVPESIGTAQPTTSLVQPDVSTPETILVDSRRTAGPRLRFQVFQRDGHKCVSCGRGRPDVVIVGVFKSR